MKPFLKLFISSIFQLILIFSINTSYSQSIGPNGNVYYIRENAVCWAGGTIEGDMDQVFGAGNWTLGQFSTINVSTLFSNNTSIVYLEGSCDNTIELSSFIDVNRVLLENWVTNGGRLFLNAAPNEGSDIDFGFGGVTSINYLVHGFGIVSNAALISSGQTGHVIFNGPNSPTGSSWSGNSFAHDIITGGVITPLITGLTNTGGNITGTVLAEKKAGCGLVLFGGITSWVNWSPTPQNINLRRNILSYLKTFESLCESSITAFVNFNNSCPASNVIVDFTVSGIFNAGNTFTAQLSDASGSFSSPVNIGSLASTTSGSINATIPANITYGTGYRIRIASDNPGVTGTDNGNDLTIGDNLKPTFTCPANDDVDLNGSCQLIVPDLVTGLTGSDNCGTVTFTQNPVAATALTSSHNQLHNVVITADDGNGNTEECTVVLTGKDVTPPTFTCPSARNVNLNSNCQLIVPDMITGLTGNDNCGTVTFTQNPAAGTALSSSNNQTHNVVITANDGNGNAQACTVVLTGKDVTNPTAICKSIEVYLGLNGTVSITGADVDNGSNDNCGAVTLSVSPNSFNSTNTGSNTVTLTVNDASGNASTCQTTVTVKKRPTTLLYTGDGNEQYSDQQLLTAELRDQLTNDVLSSKLISFTLGSQPTSGTTNGSGIASANLILIQDPAPVYTVKSAFAGDAIFVASNDEDPFDILQEDARAYYTGTLFASTGTGSTTTITLSATIRDITAESGDPAYDNFAGDIRNAKVSFIDRTTNAIIATVPGGLVSLADPKTGTATFSWNVNIGTSNSRDYTIGIVVNNYYTRNVSAENTIVTVSKSMDDFITGGGYLKSTSSSGQKAGDQGANNNFGFNVKFNKSKTNLQGNINTIIRRTEADGLHVYQVKGNSMTSLSATTATSTAPGKATFNGKASIQDITNPLLPPIPVDGGASLQVTMTDSGEPGTYDAIAITVWNKQGGLWFASNWDGVRTQEQLLAGGNLRVNTGSPNPGTISNTLTITSSASPSLSSQAVTFKATVIENNAATPTGYIMFMDGTTVLATVPVTTVSNVTSASFVTSGLTVGSHQVKAYYSGDSKFGSNITAISQTVNASLTSTRPASVLIRGEKKYSANFEVIASPNPTSHSFSIAVRGNYGTEKTRVRVFNVLGRLVETRNSVTEGQTFKLGENYRPGIYLIEVVQGKQRRTLKLMKQSE